MKKIAIFCALLLGVSATANAATAVNPRGQSASGTTNNASTTGTRTGTAAARSATTARSATGTRSSTTTSTTARSATAGRTTVSRTPTSASTSSTTSTARSATVAARAGATQKVIGTGTTVAAANQNVVVSEACRQKYYGCMDSFCMLDNDSGGRCICSDKNAEYDDILAQIEALDLQSYQMATYGVERIEMGDAADVAIANANAVAHPPRLYAGAAPWTANRILKSITNNGWSKAVPTPSIMPLRCVPIATVTNATAIAIISDGARSMFVYAMALTKSFINNIISNL